MNQPLWTRSVAETHLYLDRLGAGRDRQRRLVRRGGELVAEYVVQIEGQPRTLVFTVPDPPTQPGYGGPEPSRLIDAGQWLAHARTRAEQVPADPSQVSPDKHPIASSLLSDAVSALDQALLFADTDGQLPRSAFFADPSPLDASPGSFDVARLRAHREALLSLRDLDPYKRLRDRLGWRGSVEPDVFPAKAELPEPECDTGEAACL